MKDLNEIINTLINEVGIHFRQAIGIFESFFSSYAETERLLGICVKHLDFISIQKHAHQLKGTAANLRIPHISNNASLIESAAKENNTELCLQYIQTISGYISLLESQMILYKNIYKLKILIVEDNFVSGKLLEQIIINLDHHSLGIISSSEQVLLSVKKVLPDLIFMDIDLSTEMNGIYTAELLSGYYSIPVVFVSVHTDESIIKTAKNYGIGYIVKPYTPKEIEEMIDLAGIKIANFERTIKTNETKLKIKNDNKIFFINLEEVIYFEARAHTILAYTDYNTYKLSTSLKELKALDVNNYFIQPHRSFLVNRTYIKELINDNYSYQIKLKCSSNIVPVSKNNVKMIKTIF